MTIDRGRYATPPPTAASVTITAAVYLIVLGVGTGNWLVIWAGIALVVLAAAMVVVPLYLRRRPRWIAGTGRVLSASLPPESGTVGAAELELIIATPGAPLVTVKVRDPRVPVEKWPEPGATLPVRVALDDPRRVRIRWDDVAAREATDEEPTFEVPPAREPVTFVDDEFDLLAIDPPRLSHVLPLEDEPSYLVMRYLFPTERYRGEWRRHWVRPARDHLATLAFAILLIIAVRQQFKAEYVAEAVEAISLVGFLVAVHINFAWWFDRFVLTNKRLMLVQGVVRRRVSSLPLLRVTDLRFVQSTLGRLLNYGDLIFAGARWRNRMRRVADLPNPTDLYLRIIEETYEPEAVEARLGYRESDDGNGGQDHGYPSSPSSETLSVAFREAIYGPTLANFDGWLSVEVLAGGEPVRISSDRQVRLEPGRVYELRVFIGPEAVTRTTEPLVVTGGVEREVVEFTVEVDSDQRALRHPGRTIVVDPEGGEVSFTIDVPDEIVESPPWLWIRVYQQKRLLQNIELVATGPAMLER